MKTRNLMVAVPMLCLALSANAQSKAGSKLTPEAAVDSLIGRSIYACHRISEPTLPFNPQYSGYSVNPEYFDIVTADGKKIPTGEQGLRQFPFGSKLVIQGAEVTGGQTGRFVEVSLNVLNPETKVSAGVVVTLDPKNMTPSRIYESLNNDWYRTHPIPSVPRLGMTEDELTCVVGTPDHRNTDARGDDQLVYLDGQMYVYIGKNGRVTNIQTSFK